MKAVFGMMLTLLLVGMLMLAFNTQPVEAEPKTIYVDDDNTAGPWEGTPEYPYQNITSGLEQASANDTIYVYNGTYYEHLLIWKSLAVIGENKSNTIIDGGGDTVIQVYKDNVTVSGFTIRNGGQAHSYMYGSGIYMHQTEVCYISDNVVTNARHGISLFESTNNTISRNTISNTDFAGIELYNPHNDTLVANTISNTRLGIAFVGSSNYYNVVSGNSISDADIGIGLWSSLGNTILNNLISNTEAGINLDDSHENIVKNNVILNSTWRDPYWGGGIYLEHSYNNIVADNTISNTTRHGIFVAEYSYHNNIVGNVMSRNTEIEMEDSFGIFFGENTYENTVLNNVITKSHRGIYTAQLSYNNTIIGNTISNLTIYACGINTWGPDNRIMGNTITNMGYVGIQLNSISSDGEYGTPYACANNVVSGNTVSNSTFGINLILAASSNTVTENNVSNNGLGILLSDNSDNNTVVNNFVSNNDYGILLFSSNNTKVYHNDFIDNTDQVLLSQSFNTTWDDGYPSGGNYWSDYTGVDLYSGPCQNVPGSDEIGDTPYVINAENQDNYPLMNPWSPPAVILRIPEVLFDPADTTCFNVTVQNLQQSLTYVDITRIIVTLENETFLEITETTPTLPYRLNPDVAVTFTCAWNWSHYRGKNVAVTVYTQQGYIAGKSTLTPPIKYYTLTIHSSPIEVTFTADGESHTTSWSETYVEWSSVSLVMPETHTVGDAKYHWYQWSDGVTSRSRTVTMNTNITLTAYYTGPYYELTVTSSPITGITFTINGVPQTTPYTEWLPEGPYTLVMPETHDGYVWWHWLEDGDTNRTKTITLPSTTWTGVFALLGDLNYDGRVDMQDIYIVVQAFGSYPDHPNWNPSADVDNDDRVDMRDIYLVITSFGKSA